MTSVDSDVVEPNNRLERRSEDQIEAIIHRAAKAAAKEALRDIGLQDDNNGGAECFAGWRIL